MEKWIYPIIPALERLGYGNEKRAVRFWEYSIVNTVFSGRGWVMLPLGVGVPIALVLTLCLALGEEAGDTPTACFILTFAFPFGWVLSGVVCWVLGRVWNGNRKIHVFLRLPLEYWGLICFLAGLGLTSWLYFVVYEPYYG